MKSFSFSESEINNSNRAPIFYSAQMHRTMDNEDYLRAMYNKQAEQARNSLNFHNITGEAVPDDVVNHFKNQTTGTLCGELVKLSDYKAQFPNGQYDPHPDFIRNGEETFKTKDFFGHEEVYILATAIPEYREQLESKSCQLYNEFAKPFIANNPSLEAHAGNEDLINFNCQNIMADQINKQPEIKMEVFNNSIWGDIFTDSIRKDFVSRLTGSLLAEEFGLTTQSFSNNQLDRTYVYTEIADLCKGASVEHTGKIMEAFNKAAQDQLKDFKQKYNEKRPEFDKNQPFKNQAFDIVDKLSDKFNQAVQGLKKVWQVVTTKNLAIEQSKDKQQTVQPQKNTPEVKQQSKAKDMER